MRELCSLSRNGCTSLWGSVLGDRLCIGSGGADFLTAAKPLQTLSRQHMLPPDDRTPNEHGASDKAVHSTGAKDETHNLWAGGWLLLRVGFITTPYEVSPHRSVVILSYFRSMSSPYGNT